MVSSETTKGHTEFTGATLRKNIVGFGRRNDQQYTDTATDRQVRRLQRMFALSQYAAYTVAQLAWGISR